MSAAAALHVAGARGVLAGEMLRLAHAHPRLRLAGAWSREGVGSLASQHPHLPDDHPLAPMNELADGLRATLDEQGDAATVLVLALPHGTAASAWSMLRAELGDAVDRLTVVDLSADHRLEAGNEEGWAYGLPELHGDGISGSRRIAAPGCFATAMQLAVVPAARAGLLDPARPWVLHAITGSSGSGAQPKPGTHHPHRHDNLYAYSWDGHRHERELSAPRNFEQAPPVHFVACSGPYSRGIHLHAALPLRRESDREEALECYRATFAGRPFVRVLTEGVPQLRAVTASNRADIGVQQRGDLLHVFCALDNVVKGGAGQALQALNLALGLEETAGLPSSGLGC